jgi:hypothetical protein
VAKAIGGPGEARVIRLPVSGHWVALRQLTGSDEVFLGEATGDDTALALGLAERLPRCVSDPTLDWSALTISDLDALILRLRQIVIGDRLTADIGCQAAGCGERIDISFGIDDYLMHNEPKEAGHQRAWKVEPAGEPGWFRVIDAPGKRRTARKGAPAQSDDSDHAADQGSPVLFRLPTVGDQLALAGRRDAAEELARRCIRPLQTPSRLRRRAEKAMEAMAPCLAGNLRGVCPKCGSDVVVYFDARQFCLRELRDRTAFIYQEVDLLARRYHWSEADILAMPRVRRANYAELARQQGGGS